jgi:MFS family permease
MNNNRHHLTIQQSAARRRSLYSSVESTVGSSSLDEQQHSPVAVDVVAMDDDDDNGINSSSSSKKQDDSSSRRPSWFVIQVTGIASLGGILFGYDLGVISGALPQLISHFDLSLQQQQVVVAILYVGGGLGAAVGGSLCDAFGRKRCVLCTDLVFLVGAVILGTATSLQHVYFGRVVVGFAVAVSGIADVSYLHEIAPLQWRGAIVSVNEACISLGFLLAFAIGCWLSNNDITYHDNSGWRIMFGASGVVALIQFVGMWNMPESPTWLQENGRLEESRLALQRIHEKTTNTNSNSTTMINTSHTWMNEHYQQQPSQLEMTKNGTFMKRDEALIAVHDGGGNGVAAITSNNNRKHVVEVVVSVKEVVSSSSSQPTPSCNKRPAVAGYDSLTASTNYDDDEVLEMNHTSKQQNAPPWSAATAAAAGIANPSMPSLRASSSSSDNSLTPFCTTSNNPTATTTTTAGGTARRRSQRQPSSSSFYFFCCCCMEGGGGLLYIAWGRLVQAMRHVFILLFQVQTFIVATMTLYRPQCYIALFLSITQQLCGQTNVLSYAPLIFANLLLVNKNNNTDSDSGGNTNSDGYDDAQQASLASVQAWATLSIGVVKFVVTVLVIWKIEALGRRFLLLTGMFTIAIGLLLLTIAFIDVGGAGGGGAAAAQSTQEQGSDTNDGETVVVVVVEGHHHLGFYLAVPGVLLVVCGYSMSFGPLTWLLTSELFPTDIRGRALGATTIVTYSAAAFVTSTFLSSQKWLGGTSFVFALYFVVTAMGLVFAFMAIPDTKDKSVQEIQDDLNDMMWWRTTTATPTTAAEAATAGALYRHAHQESFTGIGGGGLRQQRQQTRPHVHLHHPGDGAMSRDDKKDMIPT